MSDIFREVEEDVRRERLQGLWKAYGGYIILLVAVLIVSIVAFEIWQTYQNRQRDRASVAFLAAQHIADPAKAAAAFADLAKTAPSGYRLLARLDQANSLLAAGQSEQALALYRDLTTEDSASVGAVARLRLGWAIADTAPRSELQSLMQPLLDPSSVWKQMAEELLAYADYRAGNANAAKGAFAKLSADRQSPDGLRNRARAFQAFLANGGAKDFGTVPPPAPTVPPGVPPGLPATP